MDDVFTLNLDDQTDFDLMLDIENEFSLVGETPILDDYNMLRNKPQINGHILKGNVSLADLFANGLIIDGGNAEVTI